MAPRFSLFLFAFMLPTQSSLNNQTTVLLEGIPENLINSYNWVYCSGVYFK